jgi:hypothetical protein
MSFSINPWDTTTADFALSPLYQFVLRTEKTVIPRDLSSSVGSPLIEKLRSFDRIAFHQREMTLQDCIEKVDPEIQHFYDLENEMEHIFNGLSHRLEIFEGNSASSDVTLGKSYKTLLSSHQLIVWDDISYENKVKLLSLLRDLIKRFDLYCLVSEGREIRKDLVQFAHTIGFFDLTKDFEDYEIQDLRRITKQSEKVFQNVLESLSSSSSSNRTGLCYGQDETKQNEIIQLDVEIPVLIA